MDDTLTVDCPSCGQPVDVPVTYHLEPESPTPGEAVVTVRIGAISHDCPPPERAETAERTA